MESQLKLGRLLYLLLILSVNTMAEEFNVDMSKYQRAKTSNDTSYGRVMKLAVAFLNFDDESTYTDHDREYLRNFTFELMDQSAHWEAIDSLCQHRDQLETAGTLDARQLVDKVLTIDSTEYEMYGDYIKNWVDNLSAKAQAAMQELYEVKKQRIFGTQLDWHRFAEDHPEEAFKMVTKMCQHFMQQDRSYVPPRKAVNGLDLIKSGE